jgi:hypothetical protein
MPSPSDEILSEAEAAALTAELQLHGEVAVAKASRVHRQTLNRAANRRRLYTRSREDIRAYLRSVRPARAAG